MVNPYIKSGLTTTNVVTGAGTINGVWACPTAKADIADLRAGYGYNYIGLGGTQSSTCNPSGNGLDAGYTPFNGPKYTFPAPLAKLGKPAETIFIPDGAQLLRPPAVVEANGSPYQNSGVWDAHQKGTSVTAPATGGVPEDIIKTYYTGKLTNVGFCDGHVKATRTQKLVLGTVIMENGAWKGEAVGGPTPAGNAGWAWDW